MLSSMHSSFQQIRKWNSWLVTISKRYSNTLPNAIIEKHRMSIPGCVLNDIPAVEKASSRDYRYIYPEFLYGGNLMKRDKLSEKLERNDMLNRRSILKIPEFYVGSVMAVSVADSHSNGKQNRFVGICIQRSGYGLRANFTLRNAVDGQGVEIKYDLYSPVVNKIDVLKLEKRLDDELLYLRDAPLEYSTVPFDYEPISLSSAGTVPINPLKVKLGPRPWSERWERKQLRGIQDLNLPKHFYERAAHPQISKTWRKHDLMLKYRETITGVESEEILLEICNKTIDQVQISKTNKV